MTDRIDATPGPATVSEAAVDTALADYAKKYRRYHNEQERWFDNGRYGEEVPRLDRLLDDVNAARTRVVDLLAARTTARAEPTDAEIEAAALAHEAAVQHPGQWMAYRFDDPYATYKPGGFRFETMRAALIAARNAGQGVQ